MFKVEIKEGAEVVTADGKKVGKINRFVLNPATNEVTHFVVQKGWLLPEDKVVPFDMVGSTDEDKVVLNEGIDDFNELPPFEERQYVRMNDGTGDRATGNYPNYAPAYYWYPPRDTIGYPAYGLFYPYWPPTETQQNIPANTVPLKEGSNVMSLDDEHVGDVERLLVEPEANRVTHLVISQGLVFKDRKMVPAGWIRSVEENKVHLSVSSKLLGSLPKYEE